MAAEWGTPLDGDDDFDDIANVLNDIKSPVRSVCCSVLVVCLFDRLRLPFGGRPRP